MPGTGTHTPFAVVGRFRGEMVTMAGAHAIGRGRDGRVEEVVVSVLEISGVGVKRAVSS